MKDDWAVRIKNSVATLVGIGDLDFGKALKATLNLGTIGLGLAHLDYFLVLAHLVKHLRILLIKKVGRKILSLM